MGMNSVSHAFCFLLFWLFNLLYYSTITFCISDLNSSIISVVMSDSLMSINNCINNHPTNQLLLSLILVYLLQMVESHQVIFATTESKVYRISLDRCSRHNNSCSGCIWSRDPYCIWNTDSQRCELNTLMANGSNQGVVPSK